MIQQFMADIPSIIYDDLELSPTSGNYNSEWGGGWGSIFFLKKYPNKLTKLYQFVVTVNC